MTSAPAGSSLRARGIPGVKLWTLDEYLALPVAKESGGCPHCPGQHYGCVNVMDLLVPPVYRCHGTEESWAFQPPEVPGDRSAFVPSCGGYFRGSPGHHYNEGWYAAGVVGAFLARFAA